MPDAINNNTPNFNVNDIVNQTTAATTATAKQPSNFRRALGAIVGGVANLAAPGLGSAIGGLIGGTGGGGIASYLQNAGNMQNTQFLALQEQVQAEQRAYETASAIMKSKHDSAMAAIRNMN